MKYNKIAMLVAGGLMVGSLGGSYAATTGTSTVEQTVSEWVSIDEINDVTMTTGALNGENNLSSMSAVTDDFCIEGNDPSDPVIFSLTDDNVTAGGTTAALGGMTLTVDAGELIHSDPASPVAPTADEKIDFEVSISLIEGKDHLDQATTGGSGKDACLANSENYTATYGFVDTDLGQKAGTYAGTVSFTISTDDA